MAETTKESKSTDSNKDSKGSAARKPLGYKDKVMRMWLVSLVVAVLFLGLSVMSTLVTIEEGDIRRENYISNLNQVYLQEAQSCTLNPSEECFTNLNETSRFAELLKKWGQDDLLQTGAE